MSDSDPPHMRKSLRLGFGALAAVLAIVTLGLLFVMPDGSFGFITVPIVCGACAYFFLTPNSQQRETRIFKYILVPLRIIYILGLIVRGIIEIAEF